jgi:DNA-binding CsgD family transcriptional regulator/GAF domain-containing protein
MRPDGSNAVAVGAEAATSPDRGAPLSEEHRARISGVLEGVRSALDDDSITDRLGVADLPGARQALNRSWDRVFARLSGAVAGGSADTGSLLELLEEIKQADQQLLIERLRHRDTAFDQVREAMALLRQPESTADLIEQATMGICTLGFDRAILSRIEDSAWIPEKVWVERDPKWGEEILTVGRENPQVLDRTLVETEMVRRKVGILVHNVQDRPAVHRQIAEASQSRSYVAVPLITNGDVVGFLHADCYYQRRELDDFDRRLLGVFAEGVGQALARTAMLDRLATIRSGVEQVAGALAAAKNQRVELGAAARPVGHAGGFLPRGFGSVNGFGQRGPSRFEDAYSGVGGTGGGADGASLTRREVEVLRLMAGGDTNGRIARRLVISEGTVKSHVKHILRKLGAANRAEAVSRWLGMEHERGSRTNGTAMRREG